MDYETDMFNTLSYDDKIINERLGFTYSNPAKNHNPTMVQQPQNTINQDLYTRILERDAIVNQVKREILSEQTKKPRGIVTDQRNHAARIDNVQGFSGNNSENNTFDIESIFSDTRFLLFLVIVLSAVCFLQWISYNKQLETMNDLMGALLLDKKNKEPEANKTQNTTDKL